MGKIKKILSESFILWLFLLLALFLRLYRIDEYMTFLGDEGRDARVLRDLLQGNLVFIGPQTSIGNMYLGPLYYYLTAPALFLSRLNPVGPAIMVAFLSVLTIYLTYLIAKKWFGLKVAFLSLILFTISPVAIIYSRSSWNPNPMPLFSLLFVYSLHQAIIKGKFKYFFAGSIALAFALQMHYLGLLLIPVALFWIGLLYITIKNKHKYLLELRIYLLRSFLVFVVLMSPLVFFDLKHNFANFNATSNAPSNSATINPPIPFHPAKCQKNPPVVPATLDPA